MSKGKIKISFLTALLVVFVLSTSTHAQAEDSCTVTIGGVTYTITIEKGPGDEWPIRSNCYKVLPGGTSEYQKRPCFNYKYKVDPAGTDWIMAAPVGTKVYSQEGNNESDSCHAETCAGQLGFPPTNVSEVSRPGDMTGGFPQLFGVKITPDTDGTMNIFAPTKKSADTLFQSTVSGEQCSKIAGPAKSQGQRFITTEKIITFEPDEPYRKIRVITDSEGSLVSIKGYSIIEGDFTISPETKQFVCCEDNNNDGNCTGVETTSPLTFSSPGSFIKFGDASQYCYTDYNGNMRCINY